MAKRQSDHNGVASFCVKIAFQLAHTSASFSSRARSAASSGLSVPNWRARVAYSALARCTSRSEAGSGSDSYAISACLPQSRDASKSDCLAVNTHRNVAIARCENTACAVWQHTTQSLMGQTTQVTACAPLSLLVSQRLAITTQIRCHGFVQIALVQS